MISMAALEKTKDEKDYKVVFKKSRRLLPTDLAKREVHEAEESKRATELRLIPREEDKKLPAQARDLVTLFYTLFHPEVKIAYYNSKAISQAVSLIAMTGPEKARSVVEFSARVALSRAE